MSHTQVGYALLMFCRCWVVVWTIQQYFVWIIVVICMYVWPDHLFLAQTILYVCMYVWPDHFWHKQLCMCVCMFGLTISGTPHF
jgi:hypothetical protein